MNLKPSDNDLRAAVSASLDAVDVPHFDLQAIRSRSHAPVSAVERRAPGTFRRRMLFAVPAALVVVAFLVNVPAVRAQVDRVLRAFTVVNGQTVPLAVRTVSLEEARAQMPFAVIAPAAIPAGLNVTINELYSEASPADSHLIFQFGAGNGPPTFTISESSVKAEGPSKLMVTERRTVGGPAPDDAAGPDLPRLPAGKTYFMRSVERSSVNGVVTQHTALLHPTIWVTRGTRIVLAAPDGALSARQIAAIQAAMSR